MSTMDQASATPASATAASASATPTAPAPEKGNMPAIVGILLPGLLAGAAAFGAARLASPAQSSGHEGSAEHSSSAQPPGPTVALEPFLVQVNDANKKTHPMKVVLAIEFSHAAKEEALKALVPRIRDATLT